MSAYTYIKKYDKFLFFAWYLLIIIVSSIPQLPTPKIKTYDSTIRLDYLIHFLEYFILSVFFIIWMISKNSNLKFRMMLLYGSVGMGAAFLGEIYQKLIPGRTFNLIDVMYKNAGTINRVALDWLQRNDKKNRLWFLFINYMETHGMLYLPFPLIPKCLYLRQCRIPIQEMKKLTVKLKKFDQRKLDRLRTPGYIK